MNALIAQSLHGDTTADEAIPVGQLPLANDAASLLCVERRKSHLCKREFKQ